MAPEDLGISYVVFLRFPTDIYVPFVWDYPGDIRGRGMGAANDNFTRDHVEFLLVSKMTFFNS